MMKSPEVVKASLKDDWLVLGVGSRRVDEGNGTYQHIRYFSNFQWAPFLP